jgi:hypothetical protein
MYNTKEEVFTSSQPQSLSKDEYIEDLETMIDSREFHSDEVSETDEEKAQEEIDERIRPKKKKILINM